MEFIYNIIDYAIGVFCGVLIGIAVLGQLFVNKHVGKVAPYGWTMRNVIGYSIRIGAWVICMVVLIFVMRMFKSSTAATLFNVLAIAVGLLTTVAVGWKMLFDKRGKKVDASP